MKKRIFVVLLSAVMVSGFASSAFAAPSSEMVITYPEDGVTATTLIGE